MVSVYRAFVAENRRNMLIDRELERLISRKAGYVGVVVGKAPLGHQAVIYAEKPGIIIGKHGGSIKDLSALVEQKFGLENLQLEVRQVENPELNSHVVVNKIKFLLERGFAQKRVVFSTVDELIKSGAEGAEVVIRGKLTTERSRFIKLRVGRIHQAGEPANRVDKTVSYVLLKPGIIGIKVKVARPDVYKRQVAVKTSISSVVESLKKEETRGQETTEAPQPTQSEEKQEVNA